MYDLEISPPANRLYDLLASLTIRLDLKDGHIEESMELPYLGNTLTQVVTINTAKEAVVAYQHGVASLANTSGINFFSCLEVFEIAHSLTWINSLLEGIDYRYYDCDELMNHPNVVPSYREGDLTRPCLAIAYFPDRLPPLEQLAEIVDLIVELLFPQWFDAYLADMDSPLTLSFLL